MENNKMPNILLDNAVDTIVTPLYTGIFYQLKPHIDLEPSIEKEAFLVQDQN